MIQLDFSVDGRTEPSRVRWSSVRPLAVGGTVGTVLEETKTRGDRLSAALVSSAKKEILIQRGLAMMDCTGRRYDIGVSQFLAVGYCGSV